MKRLAYVCLDPGVPAFGGKGCSVHVQEVLRVFVRLGWRVDLFCARLGGEPPPGLEQIHVHEFPAARGLAPARHEQAVHNLNPLLLTALKQSGPFDLIYERHALWSHAAGDFAHSAATPLVLEVNAPLIDEQAAHRRLVDRSAAETATRRVLCSAAVVAAVSPEVAAYCEAFGAQPEQIAVTPNGVCTDRFAPGTIPRDDSEPFTVGFVGSLRPWHAVGDLVSAFTQLHTPAKRCRLVIVGDGPGRAALTQQIESLLPAVWPTIHFTGQVAPADVAYWLAQFDAAAAPYTAEGECYFSPLKLYEYLACGLPVVAARVGSLPKVVEHGETGLLYAPGDIADLAAQLARLRDDRVFARKLGAAARLTAVEKHSWRERVEALLDRAGMYNAQKPTTAIISRRALAPDFTTSAPA